MIDPGNGKTCNEGEHSVELEKEEQILMLVNLSELMDSFIEGPFQMLNLIIIHTLPSLPLCTLYPLNDFYIFLFLLSHIYYLY